MAAEHRIVSLVGSERLSELAAGAPVDVGGTSRTAGYAPGDRIANKYRLVRLIGKGGMGVVWEAHSDALDIRVAIKLIHPAVSNGEDQKRLIREAKAVARLVDPAIIRVFDCGETPFGEPYIVMELLEGQDFATRLDERGRISPIETVRTLLPIIRALGTAHHAKVVHRDVKPENVFLTKSGTGEAQPKLLDFGLAKIEVPLEKRLTHVGAALGSPSYMSPEQARGEEVDRRADLWAVSVMIYEAIAGQLPFDGENYNAIMYAILSATAPSFMELSIDEPELWAIVARGLERDCGLRWQTSPELVNALSGWLIDRGVLHDLAGVSLHAKQSRSSYVWSIKTIRLTETPTNVKPIAAAPTKVGSSTSRVTLSYSPPVDVSHRQSYIRRHAASLITVSSAVLIVGLGLLVWRHMQRPVDVQHVRLPLVVTPAPRDVQPAVPAVATPQVRATLASPVVSSQPVASVSETRKIPNATVKPPSKKPSSLPQQEGFKNPFE